MMCRLVPERHRLLFSLTAIACVIHFGVAQAETPARQRQKELIHLLRNDCGACHGLRLTGGLGPPLRPATLKYKTPDKLKQVILHGQPGTPMPGWAPFITESEAQWLVELLVSGVIDEN